MRPESSQVAPVHPADAFDEQSITVVRTVSSSVAGAFKAWTDPALMRQWLAPPFCKIVEMVAQARSGGRFRMVIHGPLGGRHVLSGEYLEVVPNERIVQTWVAEGHGTAIDRYETLVSVWFRPVGDEGTEITIRQERLITREDRAGNEMGWRMCVRKLAGILKSHSERRMQTA